MGQRKRAESVKARSWDHGVAANNELDERRHWVVWGIGPRASEQLQRAEQANDIGELIARTNDAEWAESRDPQAWCVLIEADKDDIDEWTVEDDAVRGFAPYLIAREEEPARGTMRGVLRDDVSSRNGRRDAGRPS